MRGLVLLAMLTGTLAHAAWNDYVEVRDLQLDAEGLDALDIVAGAGSLIVEGDDAADGISVAATITVSDGDEERARRDIERDMTLRLERQGDRAVLESYFESAGLFDWGRRPTIALEVRVPSRLALEVDDGAGSTEIRRIDGPIRVEDGSGSLVLVEAGSRVDIEDGSGSIRIDTVGGDVRIIDGSGSVTVRGVAGSVFVEDGSGSIDVDDVARDLIVEESGSGGVRYANVRGEVEIDE